MLLNSEEMCTLDQCEACVYHAYPTSQYLHDLLNIGVLVGLQSVREDLLDPKLSSNV